MDFKLSFNMDNDAFVAYPEGEVDRILRDIANRILDGRVYDSIRDYNGNKVGEWSFSD